MGRRLLWPLVFLRSRQYLPHLTALLIYGLNTALAGTCAYHHVNQATDLFPSGPGTSNMTCLGCSLNTTLCRLTCKRGCLLPNGKRGPAVYLSLVNCDPATHVIAITAKGKMTCQEGPSSGNVTLSITGTISVVMAHRYGSGAEEEVGQWKLQEDGCSELPLSLDFGGQVPALLTGDQVQLQVELPAAAAAAAAAGGGRRRLSTQGLPAGYSLPVRAATVTGSNGGKDFIVGGKPVNLTTAVFSIGFCGKSPAASPDTLRARFFSSQSAVPGRSPTLERMFATCSFGRLQLPEPGGVVLPVENMDCIGTRVDEVSLKTVPYNLQDKCGDAELFAVRSYAKQLATTKYKSQVDWPSLKRLVLVLPDLPQCPWLGLGNTGCAPGTQCNSYILADTPRLDLSVMFQEMMHNTGLYHSERLLADGSAVPYGEAADPMGGGEQDPATPNGIVCTNAAQAWKAGWASPIDDNLSMANLSIGNYYDYSLPVLGLSGGVGAMVRIQLYDDGVGWQGRPLRQRAVFVSYRARTPVPGFDSGLPAQYSQRVHLHQFDGVAVPRTDPWTTPTYLLGLLDSQDTYIPFDDGPLFVRRSWIYTPLLQINATKRPDLAAITGALGSLNITLTSKNATAASVTVCRFVDGNEAGFRCTDGIDNDCDGLTDEEDPDCADAFQTGDFEDRPSPPPARFRPPPSPSPPPAPPPPPRRKSPPPSTPPPPPSPSPSPLKKNAAGRRLAGV